MNAAGCHHGETRAKKREDRQGGGSQLLLSGGDERSEPESHPSSPPVAGEATGGAGGAAGTPARSAGVSVALPCLFVTTASKEEQKEEKRSLPGPRKKQADALTENIKWMAQTFGKERIGFLTLTLGDLDAGGKFRNLRDRKAAQKRFHSLLTNVIAKRHPCGVTVTERHRNGGIHFHLAVVCRDDIRGNIDFEACFPRKDKFGGPVYKPDYATANGAIKREWAFWRRIAKKYGFGRHQLQPMRENGEALGRYLGDYLKKDWNHRWPEDKGARCLRYFGHWAKEAKPKGELRKGPPTHNQFGWMTQRARAWREMVKQVVIVLKYKGAAITQTNIKFVFGRRWAWKMGRLFEHVRFEPGEWLDWATRLAIEEHNRDVKTRWLAGGGNPKDDCWWHLTEITLDHLRPSREWKRQMRELQLAKDCESEIRKGVKRLAKKKRERAEQMRLVKEVGELFAAETDPF